MGWNDHVDFIQMQCHECLVVDLWEFWDDVAKARYGGKLGEKLGHNENNHGRCPHCGSNDGDEVDE